MNALKTWLLAKVVAAYGDRWRLAATKLIREALSGAGYSALAWVATATGTSFDYSGQVEVIAAAVAAIVVSFGWSLAEKWLGISAIETAAAADPAQVSGAADVVKLLQAGANRLAA